MRTRSFGVLTATSLAAALPAPARACSSVALVSATVGTIVTTRLYRSCIDQVLDDREFVTLICGQRVRTCLVEISGSAQLEENDIGRVLVQELAYVDEEHEVALAGHNHVVRMPFQWYVAGSGLPMESNVRSMPSKL